VGLIASWRADSQSLSMAQSGITPCVKTSWREAGFGDPKFAVSEAQTAAARIERQVEVLTASTERDIEATFAGLKERRVDALLVSPDLLFYAGRAQLAMLAESHAVPAIYWDSALVKAGGLISYGSSVPDMVRQIALYTGRILNGEKSSELPVLQPTKFELVINLNTAKALGLTIPETLLATADEVIQ
jgi:putative tryptophan/tyrosine transport system substrate-binding protein